MAYNCFNKVLLKGYCVVVDRFFNSALRQVENVQSCHKCKTWVSNIICRHIVAILSLGMTEITQMESVMVLDSIVRQAGHGRPR